LVCAMGMPRRLSFSQARARSDPRSDPQVEQPH
jgi:hypothetical protein